MIFIVAGLLRRFTHRNDRTYTYFHLFPSLRACEAIQSLNKFLYLLSEISPFRIQVFYEFKFLFSVSSLELLFSHDREIYIFKIFIVDTEFAMVFLTKSFNSSIFMFFNSSYEIICYSSINRSISFTCHDVDISGFHSGIL